MAAVQYLRVPSRASKTALRNPRLELSRNGGTELKVCLVALNIAFSLYRIAHHPMDPYSRAPSC